MVAARVRPVSAGNHPDRNAQGGGGMEAFTSGLAEEVNDVVVEVVVEVAVSPAVMSSATERIPAPEAGSAAPAAPNTPIATAAIDPVTAASVFTRVSFIGVGLPMASHPKHPARGGCQSPPLPAPPSPSPSPGF